MTKPILECIYVVDLKIALSKNLDTFHYFYEPTSRLLGADLFKNNVLLPL